MSDFSKIANQAVIEAFEEISKELKNKGWFFENYQQALRSVAFGADNANKLISWMYIRWRQLALQAGTRAGIPDVSKQLNINSATDERLDTENKIKNFNYPIPLFMTQKEVENAQN